MATSAAGPEPVEISIEPEPTGAELAAILAAYRELWPRPVERPKVDVSRRWKFSGRWWSDTPMRGGRR